MALLCASDAFFGSALHCNLSSLFVSAIFIFCSSGIAFLFLFFIFLVSALLVHLSYTLVHFLSLFHNYPSFYPISIFFLLVFLAFFWLFSSLSVIFQIPFCQFLFSAPNFSLNFFLALPSPQNLEKISDEGSSGDWINLCLYIFSMLHPFSFTFFLDSFYSIDYSCWDNSGITRKFQIS